MSRAGDFFRSLVPGDDEALAAELRQSAQAREQTKRAKKRGEAGRERARAQRRNLPRLG